MLVVSACIERGVGDSGSVGDRGQSLVCLGDCRAAVAAEVDGGHHS